MTDTDAWWLTDEHPDAASHRAFLAKHEKGPKPLRDQWALTCKDGIRTTRYTHRPRAKRMIHGLASTPTVSSNRQSFRSVGCQAIFPIPLLCRHANFGKGVGLVTHVRVRENEVYAQAEIFDNAAGDHAWEMIKRGDLGAFSVGYGSDGTKQEAEVDGVRFYSWWRMNELSICPKGANPDCVFEVLHGGGSPPRTPAKASAAPMIWKHAS